MTPPRHQIFQHTIYTSLPQIQISTPNGTNQLPAELSLETQRLRATTMANKLIQLLPPAKHSPMASALRRLKTKRVEKSFLLLLLLSASCPTTATDAEHYSFERVGPALLTSDTAHVCIDLHFDTLQHNAQHAHDLFFLHSNRQPTGLLAHSFETKYKNFLHRQELVLSFLTHLDPNKILRLGPSEAVAKAVANSNVTGTEPRPALHNDLEDLYRYQHNGGVTLHTQGVNLDLVKAGHTGTPDKPRFQRMTGLYTSTSAGLLTSNKNNFWATIARPDLVIPYNTTSNTTLPGDSLTTNYTSPSNPLTSMSNGNNLHLPNGDLVRWSQPYSPNSPPTDQTSEKVKINGHVSVNHVWNKKVHSKQKPRRSSHSPTTQPPPASPKTRKQVIAAVEEHLAALKVTSSNPQNSGTIVSNGVLYTLHHCTGTRSWALTFSTDLPCRLICRNNDCALWHKPTNPSHDDIQTLFSQKLHKRSNRSPSTELPYWLHLLLKTNRSEISPFVRNHLNQQQWEASTSHPLSPFLPPTNPKPFNSTSFKPSMRTYPLIRHKRQFIAASLGLVLGGLLTSAIGTSLFGSYDAASLEIIKKNIAANHQTQTLIIHHIASLSEDLTINRDTINLLGHQVMLLADQTKSFSYFHNDLLLYLAASDLLQYSHDTLNLYTSIIEKAQQNKFATGLLSVQGAKNTIEQVQSLAKKKNLELASTNINHFYQYPTSLIHTQDGLSIIIHCPLVSKQSLFTLYRYHSFPIPLATTYGLHVEVTPANKYLAINNEHNNRFAEIDNSKFDKCKSLGNIHLCQSVVAINTNTSSSCLMTLFSHNHKQALKLCPQSIVPAVDSVLPLGDNRFLSYTQCLSCTYSITCANKTSIGHQLRRTMVLGPIEPSCYITLPSFIIHPSTILKTHGEFLPFNFLYTAITDLDLMNATLLNQLITSYDSLAPTNPHILHQRYLHEYPPPMSFLQYLKWAMLIILTLIILFFSLLYIKRCIQERSTQKDSSHQYDALRQLAEAAETANKNCQQIYNTLRSRPATNDTRASMLYQPPAPDSAEDGMVTASNRID